MRNKQKGFSLIELLIVVAIILIIAAIAIPNLLRSKMAANEASAVASLRTYNTSIVAYQTTYGTDPTTSFAQLGPVTGGAVPSASAADLVDSLLGIANPAIKSGFSFTYTPV
jgi:prepilin-type N-terminal cleavage/methylation domain-containing protein